MKKYCLLLTLTLLGGFHTGIASATVIDLGRASAYNAFIQGNFVADNSITEGRVAAGGNVTISHYSINIKDILQLYTDTDVNPALVVGGDLDFTDGQIAGDVYVGGTYDPNESGNITHGTLSQDGLSPIDFAAEFILLTQLSNDLSQLSPNSAANDQWGETQYLVGAGVNGMGGDMHTFSLDATDVNFSDYLLSDIDEDDAILFNVSGTDISTSYGNFAGSDNSLKALSDHIVYNFYEAESLTVNAAIFGLILAPTADITAPSFGMIEGQVIAHSWEGNAQISDNPFAWSTTTPATVSVPEPSSLGLFSFVLFGLLARYKQA